MNSKVVSKLIRSEVWPLLRQQGFSAFDSRNAWRHQGATIDVVNFQSFNAYLADSLGCTTFSFALSIGTYVIGGRSEEAIKRDKSMRLLPQEYHCTMRKHLKKRSTVDGFERDDIFFMDADGRTAAACFREACALLSAVAIPWFDACHDLSAVVERLEAGTATSALLHYGVSTAPSSLIWNDTLATLRLAAHPVLDQRTHAAVIHDIDRLAGSILDVGKPVWGPLDAEGESLRFRSFLTRAGAWAGHAETTLHRAWDLPSLEHLPSGAPATSEELDLAIKKELWPVLRQAGFAEFSRKLARRRTETFIEIVAVEPLNRVLQKRLKLPSGLFHVGLGIFWPVLSRSARPPVNRAGKVQPSFNDCHVVMWLIAEHPPFSRARCAFGTIAEARDRLLREGLPWLEEFRDPASAVRLASLGNIESLCAYPMMRGWGSASSAARNLMIAAWANLAGDRQLSHDALVRSENAIGGHFEHLQLLYRDWLEIVRKRVGA